MFVLCLHLTIPSHHVIGGNEHIIGGYLRFVEKFR